MIEYGAQGLSRERHVADNKRRRNPPAAAVKDPDRLGPLPRPIATGRDGGDQTPAAPGEVAVTWRIVPSGDSCLVVEVQSAPAGCASAWAAGAAALLRQADLPGLSDVVPAIRSVGVHYRPAALHALALQAAQGETPYQAAARVVAAVLQGFKGHAPGPARLVEVCVCYGGEHGPDLEAVAAACGLSAQALIDLHSGAEVAVLMIGFAPGLPYIGSFDPRLSPPRRAQPRTAVAAGSVGLANRQSVIYPFTLPGGWNLIGKTPLKLFDPAREPACLLHTGDRVRFVPISAQQFDSWGAE